MARSSLYRQALIHYTGEKMSVAGVLSKEEILKLMQAEPPLVEKLPDPHRQIQPNGIDMTLRDIAMFETAGTIHPDNSGRILSRTSPLVFDGMGSVTLMPGCYLVTCNEIVNLPRNVMALARPRSSLLRCGVTVQNAVWDAGYSGRSQALMVVYNPLGFRLYRNSGIIQMVFFHLSSETAEGYNGIYQNQTF